MRTSSSDGRWLGRAPAQDVVEPQHQLARLERLRHVIVDAGFQTLDALLGFRERRQHADGDVARRLEVAREVEPAFARHHHVEQDEIEIQSAHRGASGCGVGGRRDAKALLGEKAGEEVADFLVVVDDEDVGCVVGKGFGAARADLPVIGVLPSPVASDSPLPISVSTCGWSFSAIMANRNLRAAVSAPGPALASALSMRWICRAVSFSVRRAPFVVQMQQALAAIVRPRALENESLADQLLQDARQATAW